MTIDILRTRLAAARERFEREALELKDSYLTLQRLAALYEDLGVDDRELADRILCEWALSENEGVRFDAEALIRKFSIRTAVPTLETLEQRLAHSTGTGAPYERRKVEELIALLTKDD